MVIGRVSNQASMICLIVWLCKPERFATIVPATAEDKIWVVETGIPVRLATPMDAAAVTCAAIPWL